MKDKLFEMLDELDFAETSSLLEKDLTIKIDNKIKKRIAQSVKKKAGFYNTNNTNFIEKIKTNLSYIFPRKRLAISFSVIFLFIGCTYTFAKTPVAFVSLDINPSIEIGINIFEKVVSYTPYNDDGNKIISNNAVTNIDAESAVNNLVDSAIHEGYVSKDGSTRICIAIASNMTKYLKYEKYLKYAATETLEKNNLNSDIETLTISLNERKEAKSLGITSGKFDLIKELQSLDSSIKIDDYKNSSITDIHNKYLELKNDNDIKDVSDKPVLTDSNITNNEMIVNSSDNVINENNSYSSNSDDSSFDTASNTDNSSFNNNNNSASNSSSNNTGSSSNTNNNTDSSGSSNTNNNTGNSSSNNANNNTSNSSSDNTNNNTGNSDSNNNNASDGSSDSNNNSGSGGNTDDSDYNSNTSNNRPNNGNHHGYNKPNNGNHHGQNKPNNGNHNGHYKPNNGNHNGHYKPNKGNHNGHYK